MSEQIHPSVRIVAEAQAICDGVDYYVVPRKIYRLQGETNYILEIEATDPPIVQDNKAQFISVDDVLKSLSKISGVKNVVRLAAERIGDRVRTPVSPSQRSELEIKRIYDWSRRICQEHGKGASIISVVPEKDQYLVDVNFLPLEYIPIDERASTISKVEKSIQALPEVSGVLHTDFD